MPAAQFSVSKYQLMPQTGAVAAMTAASGSPICRAWFRAAANRVACARACARHTAGGGAATPWPARCEPARRCRGILRGIPSPHRPLDPPRRPAPEEVERIDQQQRDEAGHQHVAGDGDRRGEQPEQRAIGAHAADVNREERRDKRHDPAAIDRRARRLAGLDLLASSPRRAGCPRTPTRRRRSLGVGRRVHRRDHEVPGGTEDAEGRGHGNRPGDCPLAPDDQEERDGQVAEHGENGQTTVPPSPFAGPL